MTVNAHDTLEFVAGDTWEIDALMLDADGNPFDLTGAGIVWTLNDTRGRVNYLTRSVGSGVTITDAPGGRCTISVSPALSAAIIPGTYRDQCRVTAAGGSVSVEWQGYVVVKNSNV